MMGSRFREIHAQCIDAKTKKRLPWQSNPSIQRVFYTQMVQNKMSETMKSQYCKDDNVLASAPCDRKTPNTGYLLSWCRTMTI